jgi:hypothetical protein
MNTRSNAPSRYQAQLDRKEQQETLTLCDNLWSFDAWALEQCTLVMANPVSQHTRTPHFPCSATSFSTALHLVSPVSSDTS